MEAEAILKKLPFQFAAYPSILELTDFIESYKKTIKPVNENKDLPQWISSVPGTPPAIEAMFKWIQDGKTNHIGWSAGLRLLRVTEEELFNWYAAYLEKRLHPELERRKDSFESRNVLRKAAGA